MSQKVQVYKNTNDKSKSFGKYFVRPVYDNKFVTTKELADFIQAQASVKRSDCKAVLDELGRAFKHFFELGQKIKRHLPRQGVQPPHYYAQGRPL